MTNSNEDNQLSGLQHIPSGSVFITILYRSECAAILSERTLLARYVEDRQIFLQSLCTYYAKAK